MSCPDKVEIRKQTTGTMRYTIRETFCLVMNTKQWYNLFHCIACRNRDRV